MSAIYVADTSQKHHTKFYFYNVCYLNSGQHLQKFITFIIFATNKKVKIKTNRAEKENCISGR
jgi:hypothetical protein